MKKYIIFRVDNGVPKDMRLVDIEHVHYPPYMIWSVHGIMLRENHDSMTLGLKEFILDEMRHDKLGEVIDKL